MLNRFAHRVLIMLLGIEPGTSGGAALAVSPGGRMVFTTAATLVARTELPTEPCGDDCFYFDGRCWCYYGELTSPEFDNPALNQLEPPF